MTRAQNIELIRQRVHKAISGCPYACEKTIRLADVLLVMKQGCVSKALDGSTEAWLSFREGDRQGAFYDLRTDDLTEQSDECITFLSDLLK